MVNCADPFCTDKWAKGERPIWACNSLQKDKLGSKGKFIKVKISCLVKIEKKHM